MFSVLKLILFFTYVKQKPEYYFLLCFNKKKVSLAENNIQRYWWQHKPEIFFRFFRQKQKYICTGVNFFRYSTQKNLRKWFFAPKDFLRYLRKLKSRKQSILSSLVFGAKKTNGFTLFLKIFERRTQFFVAEAQHFGAKTKCFWVRLVFCVI